MYECSFYPVLTMREFTMDTKPVYDYRVVDDIRAKEAELQDAIDKATRSIKLLTASVIMLRNARLSYEMAEAE